MLEALQGNILKGHGRPETVNIFFRLDPAQAQASRRALRKIGVYHLTSAYEQLLETDRFQESGESGKTFVAAFLSFTGYQAEPDAFLDALTKAARPLHAGWTSVVLTRTRPIPRLRRPGRRRHSGTT